MTKDVRRHDEQVVKAFVKAHPERYADGPYLRTPLLYLPPLQDYYY